VTAPLLDDDPFILPLPTPDTLVVLPQFATSVLTAHLNTPYSAMIWHTTPLSGNPSARNSSINWHRCPEAFLSQLKLAAWTMINGELRPTFVRQRHRMRSRVSADTIATTVTTHWVNLATWLNDQGFRTLAACDATVLHDYGQHLRAKHSVRSSVQTILSGLTRLWAYDQLTARPAGIGRPPWDQLGVDDYLPATSSGSGENQTEPVAEQVMGPLLVWAMRMVDDLSDDILRAWAEGQRLVTAGRTNRATPKGKAALRAYMTPLIENRAPLPTILHRGRLCFAREYIQGLTGAAGSQLNTLLVKEGLVAAAAERPGRCPLDVAVTGTIAGSPWRDTLDLGEMDHLMMHLGTACFIVIAYLTGMRPGEVLGLRSGCCPEPEPDDDGRTGRHLIRGKTFKTARDEHGNHNSAGVERDVPWVAITPVINAIRVLERMVPPGSLLFDKAAHDVAGRRQGTGSLKLDTMRDRVEAFITWANAEANAHSLLTEAIPPDPHGAVGTGRFRRSLAWHIARRPGGLVALAIQYGHLRTAFSTVTDGYASRSRSGIHDLIDIETARAVADTVTGLNDHLEDGGGVSGPAARRAIKAAAKAPRFAGTVITATTAKRLIANEDAMIYDNPQAFVLCHYKRAQALCHRDGIKDTPTLDRCVPGCGNIIRTDEHAVQLRERADVLNQRAAFTPRPIGDRLRANAARLRDLADTHDHTRITLKDAR
jgi:hypothetical protein